ncbi:citrate lyase subunit beta [Chania multitudinisentens RB-25]|uniref:Citrate lyase subunit beta n=1 Tax=Chania multitudinisentens RB-25 TaxID=1441930 RepID=W0L8V8_9GAMM|nr:CoA ester lyase [Chania multitudinisentens]AHG18400.1 citrate lyase subunit beta [Chania multitudinisentens RB-25]
MKEEMTYLFVPANRKDFFPKALICGTDAIILDLEDSVHPTEKSSGRENIIDWFREFKVKPETTKIYIRVNHPDSGYFRQDFEMLTLLSSTELTGIFIPKLEHSDTVDNIQKLLPKYLQECLLIGIIETAYGIYNCEKIATSGIARIAFGSLDYSLDINCQQSRDALLYARSRIVVASRIAELPAPIDCVTPEFSSNDILTEDSLHASSLGFGAKLCIHPEQIFVISSVFSPSKERIQWAKKVIEQSHENYAFQIEGSMIDLPLIKLARRLLKQKDKEC